MSRIIITGGTGSLGHSLVKHLVEGNPLGGGIKDFSEIRVFSRNETSQYKMQQEFGKTVEFVIGDVRDFDSLYKAFEKDSYVVHAAAIKHIDIAERNPDEAIKSNVNGATNVANAALRRQVKNVIAISSDKACNPNSTYGTTKLLAEKIFINANQFGSTKFSNARFGNLLGSNGSVFHLWKKSSNSNLPLKVTDKRMTRFFLKTQSAAEFIWTLFSLQQGGETYVPKLFSYQINEIADYIQPQIKKEYIGLRMGEKLHEELLSSSESFFSIENHDIITIEPAEPNWKYKSLNTETRVLESIDSKKYLSLNENPVGKPRFAITPLEMMEFLDSLPDA